MRLCSIGVAVMFALGLTGSLRADLLLIFDNSGTPSYQQTENSPCIFGHTSAGAGGGGCAQPAGWPTPVSTPQGSKHELPWLVSGPPNVYSSDTQVIPALSVFNVLHTYSFILAIDVNQAGALGVDPINMTRLDVYQGATQLAHLAAGTTTITQPHSGNGWSDAISQPIAFNALGEDLRFVWNFNSQSGGFETLFLVGSGPIIPEPTSIMLLGTVLVGIGVWQRKRISAKH